VLGFVQEHRAELGTEALAKEKGVAAAAKLALTLKKPTWRLRFRCTQVVEYGG